MTTRLGILIATYLLISIQRLPGLRVNRPAASLIGAVAMVVLGGLPLRDAYAAIDLDVILFLLGVMLVTAYLELGGFFEWAAGHIVRRMRSPRALLAALILACGLLSALFVNDTICLVFTPLVLAALRPLRVRPLPYLLAIALSSNVGSAMTITGNPQNMLIGVASGIPFARFAAALALPSLGGLVIVYGVLVVAFRQELRGALEVAVRDATVSAPDLQFDAPLVARALVVFGLALCGWLAGLSLPLVSITAGAVMIAVANRDATLAFERVEWSLLLFFGALFVVMRGVRDEALVGSLTTAAVAHLHGPSAHDAAIISVAMAALSNLVSNVPAVILWLPAVRALRHADWVWLVMAMSSTFAGNLTLLGSMANLIVAERAEARGVPLPFLDYLRVGVPITLLTLVWGVLLLVAVG